MPAIRSRMSSSSSTMRISDAISDPFLLIFTSFYVGRLVGPLGVLLAEGEGERDGRALPVFGVGEGDVPAMVFHDLAHDREAEPRALGARGDVRLGQAMAVLRRQSDAIVGDAEAETRIVRLYGDEDTARLILALGDARQDALAGILENIGERLGNQPAIALEPD